MKALEKAWARPAEMRTALDHAHERVVIGMQPGQGGLRVGRQRLEGEGGALGGDGGGGARG